jgi:hypothetical protein
METSIMTDIIAKTAAARATVCGASDRGSFFLPSFGFASANEALAHHDSLVEPQSYLARTYAPFLTGRSSYVVRPEENLRWDVDDLLSGRAGAPAGRAIWTKLGEAGAARPAGGYNVALLVEGPRQFYQHQRHTNKRPKWWYRLAEGSFDCYTAWGRKDGIMLGGGMNIGSANRVYAARSGRGAIYLARALFDSKGAPDGYRCALLLVEFTILDSDRSKDDMLKTQLVAVHTAITTSVENPWHDSLDNGWQRLAQKAYDGFCQHCRPLPAETEAWRAYFLDQSSKWLAHLHTSHRAAGFADGVRGLDWQDALALVHEAWQLKVVLGVHCDRRFDESTHRDDTHCSRVWRMLSQHNCSAERKDVLRRMVHDYVEPDDHIWNYSGD